MLGINAAVDFVKVLPSADVSYIVPIIEAAAEDKSWRVRYQLADHITDFQAAINPQVTERHLVNVYQVSLFFLI